MSKALIIIAATVSLVACAGGAPPVQPASKPPCVTIVVGSFDAGAGQGENHTACVTP